MKKTIVIHAATLETRETSYFDLAETAVDTLDQLVKDIESGKLRLGETIYANKELLKKEGTLDYFDIKKTIDTDAMKEPLENIKRLIKKLHEENEKLKSAIVDELTKVSAHE